MTATSGRSRPLLRLAGVIAGITFIIVVLQLAGRGDLAAPPLGSWSAFRGWLEDRDGITAAFAILRLVALILAWYLAVVVALGGVGRLAGSRRVVAVTDAATIPPVRRFLATLAGAGLASAATLTVAPVVLSSFQDRGDEQAAPVPGRPGDRLVLLPDGETAPEGDRLVLLPDQDGTATMRQVPAVATWTVEPGDHFWCIAEETLTDAWGRPPTDAEIVPFWTDLIERNRQRLAHPDDPDLIFPGQVFEVPTPPPTPPA